MISDPRLGKGFFFYMSLGFSIYGLNCSAVHLEKLYFRTYILSLPNHGVNDLLLQQYNFLSVAFWLFYYDLTVST